ncbi:MAG: hypothetical protein ABL970_11570 [Nitrospira sp.]
MTWEVQVAYRQLTPNRVVGGSIKWEVSHRMLLPYPIDLVPEYLGRLTAKLRRWDPIGHHVLLKLDDGPQLGMKLRGTIRKVFDQPMQPSGILIELEAPWNTGKATGTWVFATPRFNGHGIFRLLVTWGVANLNLIEGPTVPDNLPHERVAAIALLSLE